jgi:hypothetical protein
MTKEEAKRALDELNSAIGTAAVVIRMHKETLDRYFAEQSTFDTIAPIFDPTLWNSSERRATEAILTPIYRAALDFITAHDTATARAEDALAKVRAHG